MPIIKCKDNNFFVLSDEAQVIEARGVVSKKIQDLILIIRDEYTCEDIRNILRGKFVKKHIAEIDRDLQKAIEEAQNQKPKRRRRTKAQMLADSMKAPERKRKVRSDKGKKRNKNAKN